MSKKPINNIIWFSKPIKLCKFKQAPIKYNCILNRNEFKSKIKIKTDFLFESKILKQSQFSKLNN